MATIPYADVIDTQPLPIDAQDVLTNPVLILAGTSGGATPKSVRTLYRTDPDSAAYPDNERLSFVPLPVIWENPDALNANYHAGRTLPWPPGAAPWLAPEKLDSGIEPVVSGITNAGSPSAVRDGDDITYATSDMSEQATVRYGTPLWPERLVASDWTTAPDLSRAAVGFRLRYSLVASDPPALSGPGIDTPAYVIIELISRHMEPGGAFEVDYLTPHWFLVPASEDADAVQEIIAYTPFDARCHPDNVARLTVPDGTTLPLDSEYGLYLSFSAVPQAGGDLRIYDFYPLYIDPVLADAAAARNVRLPALSPRRVTVQGYVAPDTAHTITGWPGGDYTAAAARHTYGGGQTMIDFEQAGSPQADTQAAIEAERARRRAEQLKRDAAGYNLTMAERQ